MARYTWTVSVRGVLLAIESFFQSHPRMALVLRISLFLFVYNLACYLQLLFNSGEAAQEQLSQPANALPRLFPRNSSIVDLHGGSLAEMKAIVEQGHVTLVFFYARWCPYSLTVAGRLMRIADTAKQEGVAVVAIDCWRVDGECRRYAKSMTYPMLVANLKGQQIVYQQGWREDEMLFFMRRLLRPLKYISSEDEFWEELPSHNVVFVGSFDFSSSLWPPGFMEYYKTSVLALRTDPLGDPPFLIVSNQALARRLSLVEENRIFAFSYHSNDGFLYNGLMQCDAILNWTSALTEQQVFVEYFNPLFKHTLDMFKRPALFLFAPLNYSQSLNHIREFHLAVHRHSQLLDSLHQPCPNLGYLESHHCPPSQLPAHLFSCPLCSADGGGVAHRPCGSGGRGGTESAASSHQPHSGGDDRDQVKTGDGDGDGDGSRFSRHHDDEDHKNSDRSGVEKGEKEDGDDDYDDGNGHCGRHLPCTIPFHPYKWSQRWDLGWTSPFPIPAVLDPALWRDSTPHFRPHPLRGACRSVDLSFHYMDSLRYSPVLLSMGHRPDPDRHLFTLALVDFADGLQFVRDVGAADFSVDRVELFIDDVTQGKVPPLLRTSPTPADPCLRSGSASSGCIMEVTTESFRDIVMDRTKDVLLVHYAAWCAACTALWPALHAAAERLRHHPAVLVARLDGDSNDLPHCHKANVYPTILLYRARRKSHPIRMESNLNWNPETILNFVGQYSSIPISKDVWSLNLEGENPLESSAEWSHEGWLLWIQSQKQIQKLESSNQNLARELETIRHQLKATEMHNSLHYKPDLHSTDEVYTKIHEFVMENLGSLFGEISLQDVQVNPTGSSSQLPPPPPSSTQNESCEDVEGGRAGQKITGSPNHHRSKPPASVNSDKKQAEDNAANKPAATANTDRGQAGERPDGKQSSHQLTDDRTAVANDGGGAAKDSDAWQSEVASEASSSVDGERQDSTAKAEDGSSPDVNVEELIMKLNRRPGEGREGTESGMEEEGDSPVHVHMQDDAGIDFEVLQPGKKSGDSDEEEDEILKELLSKLDFKKNGRPLNEDSDTEEHMYNEPPRMSEEKDISQDMETSPDLLQEEKHPPPSSTSREELTAPSKRAQLDSISEKPELPSAPDSQVNPSALERDERALGTSVGKEDKPSVPSAGSEGTDSEEDSGRNVFRSEDDAGLTLVQPPVTSQNQQQQQ